MVATPQTAEAAELEPETADQKWARTMRMLDEVIPSLEDSIAKINEMYRRLCHPKVETRDR